MAFNAGAIVGTAKIDDSKWNGKVKGMVKGVGALTAAVGVAATAALVKATKAADDWQKSLSNVNTLLDTSVVNTQDMAMALLELDAELGSTKELTDAMYQSFSAGASDMEEALQITTDSAVFATAALTDTATAVDVLTTAQNAYGKETVDTTKASDVLFTTIKQGKVTGEELASTIGKSIPLFASLNIPIEELGSGMAAMTKQGVNAAESTTQLNAIVNSFLKPSEDMAAALEEVGFQSGSALLEAEGLSGALEFLEDASGGSKDELSRLLPSVEAVRGALALTGTGGEEFTKILGEMENASGATQEAFEKQEITWETFQNQMGKIELVIGNISKFFVDELAVSATTAGKGILTFITSSAGMELVGNMVGAVAGTFELLKEMVDPIVEVLDEELSGVINTVVEELVDLGLITGEGSGAFELLAFATQGVVSGLRIVGSIVTLAIKSLSNLTQAVMATGKTVGTFFDFLTRKATWDDVKQQASATGEAFQEMGQVTSEEFFNVVETIKEETTSFTDNAKFAATEYESTFKLTFDNTKQNVVDNYAEMLTGQEAFVDSTIAETQALTNELIKENDKVEEDTVKTTSSMKTIWDNYWAEAELTAKGVYTNLTDAISFGLDSWGTLTDQYYTNEQAKAENDKNAQLDELEDRFDKGLISQEEYESEVDKIEQDALDASNEKAEAHFETQKALRIAGVWMDAASSIAGWWAQAPLLGPIAGPAFAGTMTGLVGGMAVAQSSAINAEEFIPAREMGGMASGITRVNEAGGEIISLPDGSQVIPNDISQQIAQNSGNMGNVINVNFDFSGANIDSRSRAREVADMVNRELGRMAV